MPYRIFLFLVLAALSIAKLTASTESPPPVVSLPALSTVEESNPNILFIIADDLGARLGCNGDELANTPHLDKLGEQGVVFRNCFTQFATCGPSRASMLSGLYPYQTGITNNKRTLEESKVPITTLPRLFRDNGYFTARVGKIFHMGIPSGIGEPGLDDKTAWDIAINNTGWDAVTENIENSNQQAGDTSGYGTKIVWEGPAIPNEEMADGAGTLEALRLMKERHPKKTGKPLALFMGYYRPHPPMISPRSAWDAISPEKIRIPFVPDGDRDDIPEINFHLSKDAFNFIPEEVGRAYTHAYYAAISFIDTEVGKLLKGLKKAGLDDNTIVVFTGDQGFQLGEHGHWHKSTFFEDASRVPLIIADLRTSPSEHMSFVLCGLIDLYPTLCELTGIQPPYKVSGQSLVRQLKDASFPGRQQVLTQGNPGGASIRTERYRYTEWDGGKKGAMLYDLQEDPDEFTNLVDDPEYAKIRRRLKRELARLMER
jgi:arylsulfatase A-like enzyme